MAGFAATAFALLSWHFRATPTFQEHLRDHPVAAAVFAPPDGGTELGAGGEWQIGEVDPFALGENDARHQVHRLRLTVDLRRDDQSLLHLVQEVAVAVERSTDRRVGARARTVACAVAPGLRAAPRICLHDVDQMLEPGRGAVTFDLVLGAGEAPTTPVVLALPRDALEASSFPDQLPPSIVGEFARRMFSHRTAPGGLLFRLRAPAWLSFQKVEGGSQGMAHGDLTFTANSQEYSYAMAAEARGESDGSTFTRKITRSNRWTWNGDLW